MWGFGQQTRGNKEVDQRGEGKEGGKVSIGIFIINSSADFKEREKELNDHLETMTQIAQKIDYENRDLMTKNSELHI